jgi:hypothetical protein
MSKSTPPPIYIIDSFRLPAPREAREREPHLTTRERRGLYDGARSATGEPEQHAVAM